MKNKLVLLLLVFLAAVNILSAQRGERKKTITGYVVDVNYQPVSGAAIMVNDETTKVVTGSEGFYRVRSRLSEQTIISAVISTKGGEPIIVRKPLGEISRLDFILPVSLVNLQASENYIHAGEKKLDIGYGAIERKDLTGSVSTLDNRNSRYAVYTSIYEMLRELPGVVVRGTDIQVQGPTSRNLSTQPLFIVDGNYVNTISHISPMTVKSVEVLKGPSASIYGVRGANGVIIIRTKPNP
ncbi:MAG: TonB-dependent receptor plug domain-containing protein [Bacteroidales bacterium]|nr:TonB-dependent receptor plug domain-containing protein [Bacteroidales bacterium]